MVAGLLGDGSWIEGRVKIAAMLLSGIPPVAVYPVSYTHLDVYKRQLSNDRLGSADAYPGIPGERANADADWAGAMPVFGLSLIHI